MGSPAVAPTIGSVTTLLTLVEALASDPEAKADYAAGPDAYLQRHGFGDLSPADVNEAVLHASNTLPAPAAAQVDHTNGLDSVAEVDPGAFHADPSDAYEDDLFGHDPGGDFDGGIDGFGDGPEALDGPLEHGPLDHDGTDGPGPQPDADHRTVADGADRPDAAHADGEEDPSPDDAGPADASDGSSLSSLQDPHGLDGDDLDGTPAETVTPPADGPAADAVVAAEPDADEFDDGTPALFDDAATDELGGGFDQVSFGSDDPFASPDPIGGGSAWYDEPVAPSYEVEIEEPEDDILDDVDDIHLDN